MKIQGQMRLLILNHLWLPMFLQCQLPQFQEHWHLLYMVICLLLRYAAADTLVFHVTYREYIGTTSKINIKLD